MIPVDFFIMMDRWPTAYNLGLARVDEVGLGLCRRHLFQLREMIDRLEDEHESV